MREPMGPKFSRCAIDYEALVPKRNEPSVPLGGRLGMGGWMRNCIIMHTKWAIFEETAL